MSADEISASALELLTRDWQDVTRHAKGMQLAINRFTNNIQLAVNEGHDSRSTVAQDVAVYADQLSGVGDQTLAFVESIEKGVEPLAMALVTEPSDEGAVLMTNTLGTAQSSAIRALGTAVLDIAEGSSMPERSSAKTIQIPPAQDVLDTDALSMPTSTFHAADHALSMDPLVDITTTGDLSDPVTLAVVDDTAPLGLGAETTTMNLDQGESPSAPIDVDLL